MQEEAKQLRLKVRELCIYVHSENSGFGQDNVTEPLAEVLKLNSVSMLAYIRKKAQEVFQKSRLDKETKAYQKALIKLEAEVRSRAKVHPNQTEHLLQLQIENLQHDLDAAHAELGLYKADITALLTEAREPKAPQQTKATQTQTKVPGLKDKIAPVPKSPRQLNGEDRRSIYKKVTVIPERLELKRNILQLSLNEIESKSMLHSQRLKKEMSPLANAFTARRQKPYPNKGLVNSEYNDELMRTSRFFKNRTNQLLARSKSTSRLRP